MPTHQFNPNRMAQLEDLLDIEYEKLHEYDRAISLAAGLDQKIALRQQIKRELAPRLQQLELEYGELLASGVSAETISESDANGLLTDLTIAAAKAEGTIQGKAPAEMLKLLNEIRAKLKEPGKSATAKLKISLPIVPMIARYELELDTESFMTQAWQKVRDFFKGRQAHPQ